VLGYDQDIERAEFENGDELLHSHYWLEKNKEDQTTFRNLNIELTRMGIGVATQGKEKKTYISLSSRPGVFSPSILQYINGEPQEVSDTPQFWADLNKSVTADFNNYVRFYNSHVLNR